MLERAAQNVFEQPLTGMLRDTMSFLLEWPVFASERVVRQLRKQERVVQLQVLTRVVLQ